MDTGWGKAEAAHQALWGEGQQDMEAHGGTDAAEPAFVSGARQPPASPPLDVTNRNPGGIQNMVEFFVGIWPPFGKPTSHLFNQRNTGLLLTQELAAIRQGWKGGSQMTLGKALKGSLAGKTRPLTKERKGDDFTARELGGRSRARGQVQLMRLAQVIDRDVE
ncbi:MAG TPA: hypothetical protein VKP04_02480 [Ktedonobacteraceae bacterium]|nr:hypothetical protein [Ktedonobacteraceae bacterium]